MIYADVYVRVRSGPYQGAYLLYEGAAHYDIVLEEGVPEGGDSGHLDTPEGSVGTRTVLYTGNGQDTPYQGIPDGQAPEASTVNDERLDETTPRQLPLL